VPDALSGATSFARHDRPRPVAGLSAEERHGERLYRANCAFCHAADGSGRNWIGSFLDSHPRDLGDPVAMAGMDLARLRAVIRSGLPGTSMPAWGQVLSADEIAAIAAYVQRVLLPSAVSESPLAAP
jgi:cytochrome c oxidase cbb3-type subunit 3